MSKLEKEIKVLNIDVGHAKSKLDEIGAKYMGFKDQKIYTYDIPTIYHRFLEIISLLKDNKKLLSEVAIAKLKVIFDELFDLIDEKDINHIYDDLKIKSIEDLFDLDSSTLSIKLESSEVLHNIISNKLINPNKWVRLRKSNDKVELTLKHIYEKNDSNIQKVNEFEVQVSDIEEMNKLLTNMGLVRRNYQEKKRYSYQYKDAEIEIDEWPMLEPYMEIECDSEETINEIIHKMNFANYEIVSLNTEQLYKRKNINVLEITELKF